MKTFSKTLRVLFLSLTVMGGVAACDGYELIKTDTMFPYGNQRTAGSGVAYVLAKMAPKKELVIERFEPAPVEAEVKAIENTKKTLERVFEKEQQK